MKVEDLYDVLECHTEMVIRRVIDNLNYEDVTVTYNNIDRYEDAQVMCIIPMTDKVLVEVC